MSDNKHERTPFFSALENYAESDIAPFDVPGHKLGRLNDEFTSRVGKNAMRMDANLPRGLDNLNHPKGVIKEAQNLMADAFGADYAFFLVNGTSVGIITMIMAIVSAHEKIIMPRNVHKSAISGLILSGAVPVFVAPEIDDELGIANGVSYEAVENAIQEHPDAKAIYIINPTYFGVVSDAKRIIDLAHEHQMAVIMDEAHGSHFAFSPLLPPHGISLGADLTTGSIHKTGGSLTQSSVLLMRENPYVTPMIVQTILSMLQSTSPSNLLLASLDVARKNLYFHGETLLQQTIELAHYACNRINEIPGFQAYPDEYFLQKGSMGHDCTKLIIRVNDLGFSGFEIFNMLRDKYSIQMELAETYVVLGVFSIGTDERSVERLINALEEISYDYFGERDRYLVPKFHYGFPIFAVRPREAFHAPEKYVLLSDSLGEIAAESVMIYPPGIPLVIPGEIISEEFLDMLDEYDRQGSTLITELGNGYIKIVDQENWHR